MYKQFKNIQVLAEDMGEDYYYWELAKAARKALDALTDALESNPGMLCCHEVEALAELFEMAGCEPRHMIQAHAIGDEFESDQHYELGCKLLAEATHRRDDIGGES